MVGRVRLFLIRSQKPRGCFPLHPRPSSTITIRLLPRYSPYRGTTPRTSCSERGVAILGCCAPTVSVCDAMPRGSAIGQGPERDAAVKGDHRVRVSLFAVTLLLLRALPSCRHYIQGAPRKPHGDGHGLAPPRRVRRGAHEARPDHFPDRAADRRESHFARVHGDRAVFEGRRSRRTWCGRRCRGSATS